jgi:hypothetical protein
VIQHRSAFNTTIKQMGYSTFMHSISY